MEEVKVRYVTPDGFRLVGLKATPMNPKGWVVLMHGITQDKNEFGGFYVDLARRLNRGDFGTFRFDFRGHGESSGTSMDISIAGDVIDIKTSLRQIPRLDGFPLAFIGTSFGSGPAVIAASRTKGAVSCLTLIAPVLDYRRTFLKPETPWAQEWFNLKALQALPSKGYIMLDGHKLSPRLIQEFRELRPVVSLAKSRIPSLIIHGDRDSMVPYSVSAEIARRIPQVRLHTLRGTDHGFSHFDDEEGTGRKSQEHKEELIREVVSFVADHFI